MDLLGFTLSVWAAIAAGVLFLAMVLACTADRYDQESPKWFVLVLALAVLAIWNWGEFSWRDVFTVTFWKPAAIYLGVGLGYALVEFWFALRREERGWAESWSAFKVNTTVPQNTTLEEQFLRKGQAGHRGKMVGIEIDATGQIAPVVNSGEVAEAVACWTLFWPAYAISLVLGDVLTALCRRFANLLTLLSRGVVRRMFSKTFAR